MTILLTQMLTTSAAKHPLGVESHQVHEFGHSPVLSVEHVDRTAASQPFPAKRRHGFGVRYGPYDWAGTATEVSGLSMDRPMSQVSQVYK